MNALVTYYTRTGNTEQIARAIYDALPIEKVILPIEKVKDVTGYGIVFIGFPAEAHSVPTKVLPLFKNLPAGQPIALFSTHGSLKGSQLPKQAIEHAISLASQAKVLGTFSTRGKVSDNVIDSLMGKAEHRAWTTEALGASEHPNEADMADAKTFALEMISHIGR